MIVHTMTFTELLKEATIDAEKIKEISSREVLKKIRKPRELKKKYPKGLFLSTVTYKSKETGNKYFIIPRAHYIEKCVVVTSINYVKSVDSNGETIFIKVPHINGYVGGSSVALIYTVHFLKRYNERFLQSDETDIQKLFETFITRNCEMVVSESSWKHEGDGVKGLVIRSTEGVSLGMMYREGIIKCNTFLSDEQLKEGQERLGEEGELGISLQKLSSTVRTSIEDLLYSSYGFGSLFNGNI